MVGSVDDVDDHGEKTILLIGVFLLDCSVFRYFRPIKLYNAIEPDSQPMAKYSRSWFSLMQVIGDLVSMRSSLCFIASTTGSVFIRQIWEMEHNN